MNRKYALFKENRIIERQEEKRQKQAYRKSGLDIMDRIEEKIPEKVFVNLKKAFAKSFQVVFQKGVGLIEKTYNKDQLQVTHQAFDQAIQSGGGRREYRSFQNYVKSSGMKNMLISTAEGSVLGVLGIGMPDILIFTGMLLRGAYETALNYGFGYEDDSEKYLIIKMMEASLAREEEYLRLNREIDEMIKSSWDFLPGEEEMEEQIQLTANAMATDMLVTKFIQGLPLVGVVGGLSNPYYYKKIVGYIEMKYHKRYLIEMKKKSR